MKRLFIFFLLIVCLGTLSAQETAKYAEAFKYDKRIHDFGTIQERNGKVSHTFTFTNTSSKPVSISEVNAWCGCTTAEYTKSAILPGKKGKVTVTFNPNRRPGKFSKEVVVMLNDGALYTRIWVKGNVIGYLHPVTEDHPYAFGEGLYFGYKVLPFVCRRQGAEAHIDQRIANDTDKEMTVEFQRVPNNRVLKMPERITLKPRERTSFRVSYRTPKVYPYNRYVLVYPVVNGKRLNPIRVNLFGDVTLHR